MAPDGTRPDRVRPERSLRLRRLLALGTTLAVLVLCWLPGEVTPHMPVHGLDKLLHAAAFCALAIAWRCAGLRAWRVLILGVALAAVTEGGQALMRSGRTGDVQDFLADVVGLLAGLALARIGARCLPRDDAAGP